MWPAVAPIKVLRLTCLKALVFQLYMVTTSLLTCTSHVALVATSPSGDGVDAPRRHLRAKVTASNRH
jgi:hypothetical protein